MRRLLHNGILVLAIGIIAGLGAVAADVAAQADYDPGRDGMMWQTESPVDATATPETSGVTDLPETGRGYGHAEEGTAAVALDQAVITVLVLLAAAMLALGGIALVWRYDRRS